MQQYEIEITESERVEEPFDLLEMEREKLLSHIQLFREGASEAWEQASKFHELFRQFTVLMGSTKAIREEMILTQETSHMDSSNMTTRFSM